MSDLIERLRATGFDKDNFPRMKQERWFPVGLAAEAADALEAKDAEIAALKKVNEYLQAAHSDNYKNLNEENEQLKAALDEIADPLTIEIEGIGIERALKIISKLQEIARKALEGK
jgi:hypothetical protein